jgi:hypothetical protein
MSKVMTMFNGHGRGAELSSAKDTAYGLLCSITEFADHERRAMSQDHDLIQHGLVQEQALSNVDSNKLYVCWLSSKQPLISLSRLIAYHHTKRSTLQMT